MSRRKREVARWVTNGLAACILIFGLPFYFGYGNPIPFLNPEYTMWDNIWLSVFPVMFVGLAVGVWYKKLGGYLVTVPVVFGLLFGFGLEREIVWFMLIPLAVGMLYLRDRRVHT